ncbi:hypothetical protein Tco_0581259 [Tanacetum coccineum]
MVIALHAKNKMKIINGEFSKPILDSYVRALWERNNDIIIFWILNTVAEHIGNNRNFINSALKLWLELQELYAQIDEHRIYQFSNDIVKWRTRLKEETSSFLMGLDDSYASIRGQILLMQPLPSVVKAYNMVRREEKQKEGLMPKPPTSAILSSFLNNQRSSLVTKGGHLVYSG